MLLNILNDKMGILLGWTAYLYYKEKPPQQVERYGVMNNACGNGEGDYAHLLCIGFLLLM